MKLRVIKLGVVLVALVGCSGGGSSGAGGGQNLDGGGATGGGGAGGSGATATGGTGAEGATGGTAGANLCNNGTLDPGEECDPKVSDLGATCESLGAGPGSLSCQGGTCTFSLGYCSCGGELITSLPAQLTGTTNPELDGQNNSACFLGIVDGRPPSKFYRYEATSDVTLSVKLLDGGQNFVSIRTGCSLAWFNLSQFDDELACGYADEVASAQLKAGDSVTIAVQGKEYNTPPAAFSLEITGN